MLAKPRYLVVDASVAASAGKSEHPESRYCRDFLLVMDESRHHIAMSIPVREEWKRFAGSFATEWYAEMVSRGRVRWVTADADKALRRKIGLASKNKAIVHLMLEDIHLIEAALKTHSTVASKDDEARKAFAAASGAVAALRAICWVNPATESESALQWLRAGARSTSRRTLKAFS
jgi:hypothetical protein